MEFAPIILFAYNRPHLIKDTLERLKENVYAEKSLLFVYSDGPKDKASQDDINKINKVREIVQSENWCKETKLIEREKNYGLAANIIDGVSKIVKEFGKVIVLEDDLITSKYFLQYINDGLDKYQDEEKVISIHGYSYPVDGLPETFFIRGADCLGWGTWKRGWDLFEPDANKLYMKIQEQRLTKEFDFNKCYPFTKMLKANAEGRVNSWAIRWYASAFLNEKLTLYPGKSLIKHIGNDFSGTNFDGADYLDVEVSEYPVEINKQIVEENEQCFRLFGSYLKKSYRTVNLKTIRNSFFSRLNRLFRKI